MSKDNSLPALLRQLREHRYFQWFIIGVILVAAVVVGLETAPSIVAEYGRWLEILNQLILWIFVAEAAIKIGSEGSKPWRYFTNGWNLFDFTIVVVCFLPLGAGYAAVLRLARILRALRLVTAVPKLQVLVGALIRSLPSMFYVTILLLLFFYIYSVMGVFLFRDNDPGHFGDIGKAMVTLFRVVTLEDWTDVMYTAYYGSDIYPPQGPAFPEMQPQAFGMWGIVYFVSFVIFGSLVMINLFIGIVVTGLSEAQAEQLAEKLHVGPREEELEHFHKIEASLEQVTKELQDLRERVRKRNSS